MRVFLGSLLALGLLVGPAFGQDDGTQLPPTATPAPADESDSAAVPAPETPAEELDALFASLAAASNKDEAKGIEQSILRMWHRSGSATIDLLMDWVLDAIEDEDYSLALDHLDAITTLAPDFPEGWNKRATIYFLVDDLGQSLADIEHVLLLEPRHFGALSGLGRILSEIGEEKRALEVFDMVLEIHPYLDEIERAAARLRREIGGRDI